MNTTTPIATLALSFTCAAGAPAQVPFVQQVLSASEDFANSVHAVDLDGDGDRDVLSTSSNDDTVAWYENDGADPPSFTRHEVSSSVNGAWHAIGADVDLDGNVDIVTAARDSGRISWWESDGSNPPSFTEHIIFGFSSGAYSVVARDLDADGDVDVAAVSINANRVEWFQNDGMQPPGFQQHVVAVNMTFAASVHSADVDGDGDVDLMSASFGNNRLAWYRSDGAVTPTFTKVIVPASGSGCRAVYSGDLDADGDEDLVSAHFTTGQVSWHENDGAAAPTFTQHVLSAGPATSNARSVHVEDVDGDGDLDVLSASGGSDTFHWFENDGAVDPSFTQRVISDTSDNAYFVFAADVTGDGRTDVLGASAQDDTVALFRQAPGPTIYCAANANSTGSPAEIDWDGSISVQENALELLARDLPPDRFGYFLMSATQDFVPLFMGSEGNLCLGAPQIRFAGSVLDSGPAGEVGFQPDLANLPQMTVVQGGETWNFQLWYRDANPGSTSNTTAGLAVPFLQ